ncbi:helix-turn-helix domain-containing protein [Flammeovirga sp. MY04]|uniref:hybrid sensor histidine kinase/response regulator transcription factor n=1 Tax=Flammeovirga sp. MY04 TaxID=1191459 RepID=UPI00080627DE|nr:hybrid sensor histidine kinase/response regulator transcription factor [Flammeovirga sp. MY04]ANQ52498.1 helix-turn-helix domain-containing protein [Flammeovirga sp. MY04]
MKYLLLTFLFLLGGSPIFAQFEENLQFDHFSVENGLSSHIVYTSVNDKNDFTWIVTPYAVQRFDGKSFRNYEIIGTDQQEIHFFKNHSGLYLDSKEQLWFYCRKGLFLYDENTDRFEVFKLKGQPQHRGYNGITENQGNYYFLSWQMILKWNPKKNTFKKINLNKRITSSCDYGTQGMLIASPNGLQIIKNDEIQPFQLYGINLKGAGITSLFKSADNTVWIGTYNKGIYLIRNNQIHHIKKNIDYKISAFSAFNNKVIAATDGYGVMVFDLDGHESDKSNIKSLSGLAINDLNVDEHNRLWVSTYGKGFYLHNPHKPYLKKINTDPDAHMNSNHGYCSFRDSKKRLLLGTDKGLVIRDKNAKKRFLRPNHFVKNFKKSDSFVINNIVEDRHQNFWVSSYGFGLFYLDGKTFKVIKSIKTFNANDKEYSSKFIVQLLLYGDNIYFKLVNGFIFEMDINTYNFKYHPISSVSQLFYSPHQGKLFLANHEGIHEVTKKSTKLIALLDKNTVTCFEAINDTKILIGTESNGIFLFDIQNASITPVETEGRISLPNHVNQIIKSGFQDYYVLGDNSIYSFTYQEGKVHNVHRLLKKIETHQGSGCINNNSLIVGTYDGFYSFPINFKSTDNNVNKLTFDKLYIDGKLMVPDDKNSLTKSVNASDTIYLNHPDRGFALDLISPDYRNDAILYNWKLEGFDEDYSKRSILSQVKYQNLPYGTYELKVSMFSGRKLKELDHRNLRIIVAPPFWKTTWAKAIYFFLFIVILWLIYKNYYDYLQQKNLKARNAVFAEIAHELRTPLTLMQGPLQKLEADANLDETASRLLGMIRSNLVRLNKRISQLLDYERINQVNEELIVKEFDVIDLTKTLSRDFEPMLEKKGVKINVQSTSDTISVKLDFDKVEKIIYNLISNSIKYTKENDVINIQIDQKDEHFSLSVEDHGMGIPKENQKHIFKRFYRAENVMKNQKIGSGIGLVLSYKYSSLMNGKIYFKSEENVQTTFFLELPLRVEGLENDTVPNDISHYGEEFSEKDKEKYDFKIAVAEDNKELRTFIQSALSDSFEVDVFENGKVCYDALLENDYDIVISDVMMPEMNGYELCDKIKGNIETSHLPIILLTALNASMYKAEGYMHGADHYVIKPFDIRMLKFRIINLVENRKTLRSLYQSKIQEGVVIPKINEKVDSLDDQFLTKIDELIDNHLTDPNYNVMEICKDVGMSRPVLYRKLKALTDLSPKEYIQTKRLNHAKKLLLESDESISNVAYESGYSDPKYFSTVFKKQFGMSPSEYLKSFESKN